MRRMLIGGPHHGTFIEWDRAWVSRTLPNPGDWESGRPTIEFTIYAERLFVATGGVNQDRPGGIAVVPMVVADSTSTEEAAVLINAEIKAGRLAWDGVEPK